MRRVGCHHRHATATDPSRDFSHEGDEPDAATIDRSGNAAANRLEAAIARIARREGEPRDTRERAQRTRRDILVARRVRGGHVPTLKHAWERLSVD